MIFNTNKDMDDSNILILDKDMDFPLEADSESLLQSMTEILDQAFQSEYFGLSKKKVVDGSVKGVPKGVHFAHVWKGNYQGEL